MVKTPEELHCLRAAMTVCDLAVGRIRAVVQPGITENQLWSVLHETNIAHGGEWIECRLLASGERTNPWFQECGNRVIRAGDMVGFDTDMVGPHGYMAGISRSLVCPGDGHRPAAPARAGPGAGALQHGAAAAGRAFREFARPPGRCPTSSSPTATA